MNRDLRLFVSSAFLFVTLTGCSLNRFDLQPMQLDASSHSAPNEEQPPGAAVPGVGSFSVPVGDAIVARIENGLEKSAVSTAGNFSRSLAQVNTNLPKVTDPTKATGYDQIQLLAYGACSDLTAGTTPAMQSRYGIQVNQNISTNRNALVSAGMRMLDVHTAGLASNSEASVKLREIFTQLVNDLATNATNTSRIAFMSVCMAANTAGSALLGF